MPLNFSAFGPQEPQKKSGLDFSAFGTTETPEQEVEETSPSLLKRASGLVPQPVKTTVNTVLDVLGRPGAATAGAVDALVQHEPVLPRIAQNLAGDRRDNFDQVLEHAGAPDERWRHTLGFAADVVADPLNLVGVGEVGKLAKLAKLDKGAAAAAKLVPEGVKTTGKAIVDALGDKFVPRYGMKLKDEDMALLNSVGRNITDPEEAREALRAFQKERSTVPTRVEKQIIERYKGTTPEFRKDVLEGMDHGAGRTPDVDTKVLEQTKVNDDLFNREVDAMVMKEGNYRPDYAPADYSRTKGPNKGVVQNPQSALNARNRHARGRLDKEMTIEEHIANGAEPDVALAQLTREINSGKAALTGEFIQDSTKKFGLPVSMAPDNWEVLKNIPMESTLGKFTSDIAFPSYIAKQLNRVVEKPREATILGKMYDQALKIWRTQATVLRPGFHSTNLQGNMFNGAYLAGALNPARYVEAATWEKIRQAADPAVKIGRYSVQEVDDFMNKMGVGGAGHSFTSELVEDGADKVLMAKLAGQDLSKNPLKHPVRFAKEVGGTIEDFSKRALFFDRLHKGDSLEQAAKTVDKYLFDYQDLTDFEKRVVRRVIPFYTWMRKNVPLQVEGVLTQPGKYAAVGKLKNDIEDGNRERGTDVPEALRPGYLQEANAIQLPRGDSSEAAKFWSQYLPLQDLNKVPIPGGSTPLDAARDVASGLEPISKGLTELITNKSLFFNRPVYDEKLGVLGDKQKVNDLLDLLPESLKRQLFTETAAKDGSPEFQTPALVRYLASQFPLVESTGKAAKSITQPEDVSNPYNWLSPVAGVRVTERNAQQQRSDKRGAIANARETARRTRQQERKPTKKAKVDSLFERYQEGK